MVTTTRRIPTEKSSTSWIFLNVGLDAQETTHTMFHRMDILEKGKSGFD
jgi:hypothetical protein